MRASIRPNERADQSGQCSLWLRTTSGEGTEFVTTNEQREQLVPLPPGLQVEVMNGSTTAQLLARHVERIAPLVARAWHCTDIEGAAVRAQYIADGVFASLQVSGLMIERDATTLSFRWAPAWERARYALRQEAKRKKAVEAEKKLRPAGASPVALSGESQLAFDLQHYRQTAALLRGKLSSRAKAVWTIGSFLLFAAVLGWSYSPSVAVSLIVALVIHEGGHLLGMRWFGFRDTQLLFIPFFGGAAVGHDDKVLRPWQHIVIILLGPLPGLFAGLAVLGYVAADSPEWLTQAAVTFAVLNGFNLLPILPLDGGQIVDYAIAARFPRARVFFLAASALALLAVAWLGDELQLIAVLAVLMLIRLPTEWRLARLRINVRREYPEGGDEMSVVRSVLRHFRAPEWSKTAMVQRLALARGLQNVLRMPRAGLGTLCFAVAGYSSPLWVGLPLMVVAAKQQSAAELRVAEEAVRGAGLERARLAGAQRAVPEGENAAALLAEASAAFKTAWSAGRPQASDPKIVELLRAAAKRPAFMPLENGAGAERASASEGRFMRGLLVGQLTAAAEERLRFRETEEAAALIVDALRLNRLLDSAPGWWTWQEHEQMMAESLKSVEEIFATSVQLPAGFVAQLRLFLDEQHEIAFAAAALPRDMLQLAHDTRARSNQRDDDGADSISRWVALLPMLFADYRSIEAQFLRSAVALDRKLKDVRAGKWPRNDGESTDAAPYQIEALANIVARIRQARAAILIMERRAQGGEISSLADLGVKSETLKHPLAQAAMVCTRRGNLDVLSFEETSGAELSPLKRMREELVWRLSVR